MVKANSRKRTVFLNFMKRYCHNKLAIAGLVSIVLIGLLVAFLPPFLQYAEDQIDPLAFSAAPGGSHLLGTDDVGRDVLSRLLNGGRVSLFVGILSALISVALGIPLGLLAAFFRGKFETVTMRLADIFLSFPNIILILFLVSIFGPSIITVTVVIGVLGWPFFARLMFGTVLSIKEKDYIEGAAAIGEKQRTIIFKYILPNAIAPILIQITFRIAGAIILESSLSFLGMGVQPPAASWGNMLYNAQSITILSERPWMWLPPGLLLILTILSINFVGNGLRDALDPKTRL
ncbi:ABC transporter permease [Paenibacillus riograndensis]|uniref:Oligopeptide ABC transporter n=2 Tax=Paenibacillus riograndensis TaxID=483937 RepID=A0A0E4CY06_9BACL|nr:ABC transporter permease [Paenibacillus riograndensis]CQR56980.1 oligopeptide ABC transporter [Paenibacillus riograndensis SBR5]